MDLNASRTVIFDFDGTIADSFILVEEGIKRFAPKFGIKIPDDFNVEELKTMPIREFLKKYRIPQWKILRYWPEIAHYMYQNVHLVNTFTGVTETLNSIQKKGNKLFILSTNSRGNIEKFLEIKGIKVFEKIYSSKNLFGKAKAMEVIIKREKLDKNKVIYVGDEVRDIEAAKECGIKIIAVAWGYNKENILRNSKPDFIAKTPEDIIQILGSY